MSLARITHVFAFLVLALVATCAQAARPQPPPSPHVIPAGGGPDVIKARDLLDIWDGEERLLRQANVLIDAALAEDPDNYEALLQLARVSVMTRVPGSNQRALELIDEALRVYPDFAEAFVLRGHVMTNLGRESEAFEALSQAERRGSQSPWLRINFGTLFLNGGLYKAAADQCRQVTDSDTDNPKAMIAAMSCQVPYTRQQRDFAAVERMYKEMLALHRRRGLVSEYAQFLCIDLDRCTEALPLAREAAGDCGRYCETLTVVLFSLWAEEVAAKRGDGERARTLLAEAERYEVHPGHAMVRAGHKHNNAALVAALLARGDDINATSGAYSALERAAELGDVESVQVLLANGADVNLVLPDHSALLIAAVRGHDEVVRILVAAGADERSEPNQAILYARSRGQEEIAAWLEQQFPDRARD